MSRILYQRDVLSSGVYFPKNEWLNVSGFTAIAIGLKTNTSGTFTIEYSPDEGNIDSSLSFTIASDTREVHVFRNLNSFARFKFTYSVAPSFFRCEIMAGDYGQLNSTLNGTIQSDADAIITRSVLVGATDGGQYFNVPVTSEGHLEVALHHPRLPFGSIHTETLTPVFQTDAVYGANVGQVLTTTSGSGGATASDSNFVASTGTTIYSQGVIQGRKRLRYRAGQGIVGRFAGRFTTPVANSYQLIGFGHAEDGVYFGYGDTNDLSNTAFGILYVNRGVREVRTLTVTTGATSAGNVTITLNTTGVFAVAVTNSSNIQRTVWEIAQGTYTGWDAYAFGATVVFVRASAGVANGTYSFDAGTTGAAATIAQTKAGVASTDLFIPQSSWNGDKLDGTGASGITIDPTKGNVYQVGIQYLGYGTVTFSIEVVPDDGNNADFVTVHTLRLPNTLTTTSFGNPSFPFTMAAYSAGSTTDLTLRVGSFAGFIEGPKVLHGNRFSYFNFVTTGNASTIVPLFTIMNLRYYGGRTNQAVINLLSVSGAVKHTQPVVYYVIKNGALTGNPNFAALAVNSCTGWDTAATGVTYSNNNQLVWTGHLGETGEIDHHFSQGSDMSTEEVTLQPGEWVTLGVKSVANNIAYATGAINTREDQ
jgi:hypothetical protein